MAPLQIAAGRLAFQSSLHLEKVALVERYPEPQITAPAKRKIMTFGHPLGTAVPLTLRLQMHQGCTISAARLFARVHWAFCLSWAEPIWQSAKRNADSKSNNATRTALLAEGWVRQPRAPAVQWLHFTSLRRQGAFAIWLSSQPAITAAGQCGNLKAAGS